MKAPGIGRMQHHMAAPIVETGGVFARGKPAHHLARRVAEVAQGGIHGDENGRWIGPAQQLLRALQDPHFVAGDVDAQQAAAPADHDLVDLHAGYVQKILGPHPFPAPRDATAPASSDPVDERIEHAPAARELSVDPGIGQAIALEIAHEARAQGGAGLEGLEPAARAQNGGCQDAVDSDIGADIDHRVAGIEIAQHEADDMGIDRGAAGDVVEDQPAAQVEFAARPVRRALQPAVVDRGHDLVDEFSRLHRPAVPPLREPRARSDQIESM